MHVPGTMGVHHITKSLMQADLGGSPQGSFEVSWSSLSASGHDTRDFEEEIHSAGEKALSRPPLSPTCSHPMSPLPAQESDIAPHVDGPAMPIAQPTRKLQTCNDGSPRWEEGVRRPAAVRAVVGPVEDMMEGACWRETSDICLSSNDLGAVSSPSMCPDTPRSAQLPSVPASGSLVDDAHPLAAPGSTTNQDADYPAEPSAAYGLAQTGVMPGSAGFETEQPSAQEDPGRSSDDDMLDVVFDFEAEADHGWVTPACQELREAQLHAVGGQRPDTEPGVRRTRQVEGQHELGQRLIKVRHGLWLWC
jgi:hypothetical protein